MLKPVITCCLRWSSDSTANITTKTLTVSGVTAQDKVYDADTAATLNLGSAAFVGVIGGDTVNIDTSSASGTFSDKNVGTGKTVTVSWDREDRSGCGKLHDHAAHDKCQYHGTVL